MQQASCPLSSTEKRLLDCLFLIVETKNNYFDPNAFRLNLNNCIQTLRNVTFVLQKNKSLLPGFNMWYEQWQDRMRHDHILRWLIEARNVIVKQGDLVTHSKARVAVVESWYRTPIFEMEVPPLTETNNLAKFLAKATPNKEAYVVGLLRLERRWVDSKLPDHELTDSLSHSFEVLTRMLLDAHEKLTNPENRSTCMWHTEISLSQGRLPPFLLAQEWDRTVWVDIASGNILKPTKTEMNLPLELREEAARRYPNTQNLSEKLNKSQTLEDEATACFDQAKNILKKDGYHTSIAIIGYPDGRKEIRKLTMQDRTEKHLIIRSIATDIQKAGANSIIFINETWFAPANDARLTRDGVKSKSLKEALQVMAADSSGKELIYHILFSKDKNGVVHLEDEFSVKYDKINLLSPIMQVWKK